LKPRASGDDEKPFNVLSNAVFLDTFILFSSCWLPKHDSRYAQRDCLPHKPDNWPVKSDMRNGRCAVYGVLQEKLANTLMV